MTDDQQFAELCVAGLLGAVLGVSVRWVGIPVAIGFALFGAGVFGFVEGYARVPPSVAVTARGTPDEVRAAVTAAESAHELRVAAWKARQGTLVLPETAAWTLFAVGVPGGLGMIVFYWWWWANPNAR